NVEHQDTTMQTFVVQHGTSGYVLVHSEFFDSLGLLPGLSVLVQSLLGIMICLLVLVFWVWMGWEAYRCRPRRPGWRAAVFVPVLGARAFFLVVWLPRQLGK